MGSTYRQRVQTFRRGKQSALALRGIKRSQDRLFALFGGSLLEFRESPVLSNRKAVTNVSRADKKENAVAIGKIIQQPGERTYAAREGTIRITQRKIDQYDRRCNGSLIAVP